ncbi:MAG: MFS transporter [Acidiferrobacterales bacterium]|nr:MFS transporter [Acidiferrobacterales bacterium]
MPPQAADAPFGATLASMLATQVAAACVLAAVPVLAPAMADSIGIDPSLVGIYSGLLFAAATVVSAWSGKLIARLGAVRTNQLALASSGLALLFASGATLPAVVLAALLVGAGYGPNTPSSSQVLIRVTPPHRRAFTFSLKQSGAPIGAMLAGFMLPAVVILAGWKMALVVAFALAAITALAVEPLRRRFDVGERSSLSSERTSGLASMRFVLEDSRLRRLVAGGVALMVVHACFQSLFVAYLVEHVALSLAVAGALYASMQASGAVARVAIGWSVDRLRNARVILAAIAIIALVSAAIVAAFDSRWAASAMWIVCLFVGIGSSGWYGAFLSEVARAVPIERAGFATGGVLFFLYAAHVVAPMVAALLVAVTGSYVPVFTAVALLAGIAAVNFGRIEPGA